MSKGAVPPLQSALARVTGARLCYGKPIAVGERTIVPVAAIRTIGGFGYGRSRGKQEGDGGGGGGTLDARPVGFIEITPHGTRFEPIADNRLTLATIAGGAIAALLATRSLSRRRRRDAPVPRRRLGRRAPARPEALPYRSSQSA
ncbi:MAG TPA: spore germination protein GerW family protein [Solirubrobacteraceae bacterium]|nr:spore germination protein GerW family protein [Solirubrobacteraceae bacterium]